MGKLWRTCLGRNLGARRTPGLGVVKREWPKIKRKERGQKRGED